ncbi:MAG: enoyl-CoA hydratase-related protein [Phycisphaerales bacterium]|nr:enoyl-CoA hydratase-related protein [Phycisphaerales bacterium]
MPTALESTPLTCKRSEEGIVSIHLSSPDRPVVILDAALLQQLDATLDALLECSVANDITGVLLCSDCSRVFIAGADLREIDALNDEDLRAYLAFGSSVFSKLALLPCPTAACIDGAALGGGLEIALHCDGLIASATNAKGKPYPIGLPECGLGLLPGWGGTQMLPARIDPRTALQCIVTGTTSMSNETPTGLIDAVVETPDDIMSAATSWILQQQPKPHRNGLPRCLDDKHPGAIQSAVDSIRAESPDNAESDAVLDAVETGLREGFPAALMTEQQRLVALRSTTSTRARLEAFFDKQN